jgi:flagellar biosynthesis regulator FlaF
MSDLGRALRAYATAAEARDGRAQEAELFRHANALLRRARGADARARARALADNARLWNAVIHLLHDPANALPHGLRAAIVSVGLTVQREMRGAAPDFEFLIAVNENIAAGLAPGG